MSRDLAAQSGKSRLSVLLEHLSTIADCDDYDDIADWSEVHLDFLRRNLPFTHGVPGGRWLTILMNRVSPALF